MSQELPFTLPLIKNSNTEDIDYLSGRFLKKRAHVKENTTTNFPKSCKTAELKLFF